MVAIEPFTVEQWMTEYELVAKYNISETCSSSISLAQLQKFSTADHDGPLFDFDRQLTYGAVPGSEELRANIAQQYSEQAAISAENVVVTQGAITANFLLLYTLIGPGDHVICQYPTYQQLYEVPKSLGAEVSLWKLTEENQYVPDVRELERLVQENTKLIIINNPNNPTGSTTPEHVLEKIVAFAKTRNITVLADEVYRPMFHSLTTCKPPSSIIEMGYKKTVSTSSMSKTYSLAGIRLGWIVSPDSAIVNKVLEARHYTTICVSQLDDQVAAYALSPAVLPNLLGRNLELAKNNLNLLAVFIDEYKHICRWVRPTSGTTAFVEISRKGIPVNDKEFCEKLIAETGVYIVPGSLCFGLGRDFPGHVRIGYVCDTSVLVDALKILGGYFKKNF